MSKFGIILNGIIKENPTFVLMLGMCPTLATTTSATNGLMMGLATMAVLIFSNIIISCIKNLTPDMSISDLCENIKSAMTEIEASGLTSAKMTWAANGEPNKEPKAVVIQNGAYVSR